MSDPTTSPGRDVAGAIACVALVAIGIASIVAAQDYSDLGAVFPRTIGALLVAFGVVWLALFALGRSRASPALGGSHWRRGAAAAVMLAWAFALGPLGFLPSSAAACGLLLLIARHGRGSLGALLGQAVATAALLAGLYVLFQHVLRVPLP